MSTADRDAIRAGVCPEHGDALDDYGRCPRARTGAERLAARLGEPAEHPAARAARAATVLERLLADLDETPGDQLLAVGELRLKLAAAMLPGRPRTLDVTIERQAQHHAETTTRLILDELRRHGIEELVAAVVARAGGRLVLERRRELGPAGVGRPVRDDPHG